MPSQPLRRSSSQKTLPPTKPTVLERALEDRDVRAARQRRSIWDMTKEERLAAFWGNTMTMRECLDWGAQAPKEVPHAADGEFLFIAVRTPEWLGE
jgi:hypothetical protein